MLGMFLGHIHLEKLCCQLNKRRGGRIGSQLHSYPALPLHQKLAQCAQHSAGKELDLLQGVYHSDGFFLLNTHWLPRALA